MRHDLTDITIVLDRSGSMHGRVDDTIGGINAFLAHQKAVPGECRLTLVQFDHEYEFVHRALPIADVPELDRETYKPRGMTALLDAVGRAIDETGTRLAALPEADRPGAVVFVILTDGEENSSKEYSRDRVREMIKTQDEVYSWAFIFMGANLDAVAEASAVGMTKTSGGILNLGTKCDALTKGLEATSSNVAAYRSSIRSRAGGASQAKHLLQYSDDQVAEQTS